MKVSILFNCQHRMLADVLRLVRPDIEVVDTLINGLWNDGQRDAVADALADCDLVLSLPLGPDWGRLASAALRDEGRRVIMLPAFSFAGFHPDTIYVQGEAAAIKGFTDDYHSRIAVAGFLEGYSVARTAGLYNALVMGRAGYFSSFAEERLLLCQSFAAYGIHIEPLLDAWATRGCFMHSVNHPKHWCYADVALALCQHAGLAGDGVAVDAALVNDDLSLGPTHPVLSPLARRLGVAAETHFKPVASVPYPAVPLERFIELEVECFAAVPVVQLEAASGVATLRGAIR